MDTHQTILFVTHNLEEALFLSQRIVFLSARPAKVEEVCEINLEFPGDRLNREFLELRVELSKKIKRKALGNNGL